MLLLAFLALAACLPAQPYGFLHWTVANGLPQSQVTALAEDGAGYLWVGTKGGGIARFDGQEFEIFTTADGLPANRIEALSMDEFGNVRVVTSRGLAQLEADAAQFVAVKADVQEEEPQGPGWEAIDERLHQQNPALPEFNAICKAEKYFLAGTSDGVYLIDATGQVLQHFTAPGDLPGDRVSSIIQDRQGRHWIGTNAGLARMIPTGLRWHDRDENGAPVGSVTALHVQSNGGVWVGGQRRGLRQFTADGFARPAIEDPTVGAPVTQITEGPDGRLFVATNGRGVVVIDPDSLTVERLRARSGLPDDRVLAVLPDTGGVWAVSYDQGLGLIRQTDSTFVVDTYAPADRIEMSGYIAALPLPSEGMFLATRTGRLLQWRPDTLLRVLGPDNGLPAGPIVALGIRRSTQLWVAISGQGVYYTDLRAAEPTFASLPLRLGVVATDFRQLLLPPDKPEVWLATATELYRVYLDRDGRPDWYRRYGRAEGFPAVEPLPGASAIAPESGQLLFGTSAGLVTYTEEEGDGYLAPPPTRIEKVNLFYAPLRPADYQLEDGQPTFTAAQNHLNFHFGAVDLTYPGRIRYQWRLQGLETEWSPPATARSVRYAGLSPGAYTFRVRASTDDGKTWGTPAVYPFRIRTPLWRQPWFLGLLALFIAGGLTGAFYGFYRRVQRVEARKRKQLEAANQLLTLEQKALQLQMNPHFIFNALNGIRGLVDGAHDVEARAQITRFATLMRGILNNSRRDRITLAEEVATLTDYLNMEAFCQSFAFTFTIGLPDGADPEEISMPSMLLQPFLENAVLHGLSGRTEPGGHIGVQFILRGRRMQCVVEDNGIGRQAAAARRAGKPSAHKSVALEVTSQRLKAMKGHLKVADVVAEDGAVAGTRVELYFPVETW